MKQPGTGSYSLHWTTEPEERVMLHGALPKVLAGFLIGETKYESVLLFVPLYLTKIAKHTSVVSYNSSPRWT